MRPIDADALIKWVQQCGAKCPTVSVEKVFNKIKDAPTIGPVKRGKWIPNSPFTGNCSECGGNGNLKDNYCPNCGARMERSEE